MRPDPYEERLRYARRERERLDILEEEAKQVDYIELEKPQFAGWDVYLTLTESRLRSRDSAKLLEVLRVIGADKPVFTKGAYIIRNIRQHKYNYAKFMSSRHIKSWYDNRVPNLNHTLSIKGYEQLPDDIKVYFCKDRVYSYGLNDYYYYRVDQMAFPMYELTFKVRKAYWSKLKVLNGDAIGEEQKLDNRIWRGSLMLDYINSNGNWRGNALPSWWKRYERRAQRSKWNQFCGRIRIVGEENEEELIKLTKIHNNTWRW